MIINPFIHLIFFPSLLYSALPCFALLIFCNRYGNSPVHCGEPGILLEMLQINSPDSALCMGAAIPSIPENKKKKSLVICMHAHPCIHIFPLRKP